MCLLRNLAMRDYQEGVTTRQTDRQTDRQTYRRTDARQSDPYVLLCSAGKTKTVKKGTSNMDRVQILSLIRLD